MGRLAFQVAVLVCLAALLGFGVNAYRDDGIPVVRPDSAVAAGEDPFHISLEEALGAYERGGTLFIDARDQASYGDGHIEGAVNLPFTELETHMEGVVGHLPFDAPIITYCDGEDCSLSTDCAMELTMMGFTAVRTLYNGWSRWREAGYPVALGGIEDGRRSENTQR